MFKIENETIDLTKYKKSEIPHPVFHKIIPLNSDFNKSAPKLHIHHKNVSKIEKINVCTIKKLQFKFNGF